MSHRSTTNGIFNFPIENVLFFSLADLPYTYLKTYVSTSLVVTGHTDLPRPRLTGMDRPSYSLDRGRYTKFESVS